MSFLFLPGFGRARSVDTGNGRAAGPSLIDDDFSEYMGVHTDTDSDDELGNAELISRQAVQQQEMQLRRLQRVLAPSHPRLPNNVRGLRGAMLCVKECKVLLTCRIVLHNETFVFPKLKWFACL